MGEKSGKVVFFHAAVGRFGFLSLPVVRELQRRFRRFPGTPNTPPGHYSEKYPE
ncbi:hypothetical protein ACGFIJ_07185 [Microbispora bryophytorum]|uniref:Uncharacterized protein n=1 Tax=Microbispora bryophytorum subsp. camponoti TaxID=1677852 RepID=A0ABR8L052_9ACTN|nr:hypothetical protein [Microbispora camponoti]